MEQSNKIERSEAWNNIYEVLARLDLKESTGDALDRPSAATEIEALFLKLLGLQNVSGSLPSDEEFETALEKEAFRVPYDGSNNFYDEPTLKHWRKCWEWVKNAVSNDR